MRKRIFFKKAHRYNEEMQLDIKQSQDQKTVTKTKNKSVQKKDFDLAEVSPNAFKKADGMSPDKAKDEVEDIYNDWYDIQLLDQLESTSEMQDKWYLDRVVLVGGLKEIDTFNSAKDLIDQIESIDSKLRDKKLKRSDKIRLNSEREEMVAKLDSIMESLDCLFVSSRDADYLDKRKTALQDRLDEYMDDTDSINNEWDVIASRMKAMKDRIAELEVLRQKYIQIPESSAARQKQDADIARMKSVMGDNFSAEYTPQKTNHKTKNILALYNKLMELEPPKLVDIDSIQRFDVSLLNSAWASKTNAYLKALDNFNDEFNRITDILSQTLHDQITHSKYSLF